jgi:hypothetical protein
VTAVTWSIKFDVADGAAGGEPVIVGSPPDGPVIITGYETAHGRMLGVQAGEFTVTTYAPDHAETTAPAAGEPPDADAEEFARAAYAAYGRRTGGRNHRGEPMPIWADLEETMRAAWVCAVTAAADRMRTKENP